MGSLSGFLTRRWTLKVAAFTVALLLWVAVRSEAPNRQELSSVPVHIELEDPEWSLVGPPIPSTVTVRFGGRSRDLISMAVDRPSVVVPVSEVDSNDTTVVLLNQWVQLQERTGVIVEDIQPSSVRMAFEPIERVELPAALQLEGELPGNLAMSAPPAVEPASIRVRGPQSRLIELDSIPLHPLDLGNVASSGRFAVEVDDSDLAGLDVQPREVAVAVQVEDRIERVVSGVPVVLPEELRGLGDLQVLPANASVLLRGPRSSVTRADPTLLEFVVRVVPGDLPGPGDEGDFEVVLTGVPPLITGVPQHPEVTVRNRGLAEQ